MSPAGQKTTRSMLEVQNRQSCQAANGTSDATTSRETFRRALLQDRWWQAGIVILIIAAGLRFTYLESKPLHNDEGVNGNFMTQLFRSNDYHYDPENYHGPSLYYVTLIVTRLNSLFHGQAFHGEAGLSTVALRIVPAIFGIATIWLILQLKPYLGRYGALGAAVLVAISPGAVYFSRYFIHEILFVFFTLGIVVAGLRFYETARPVYLMLASASAALLVATKETSVISLVVLGLAYLCTTIYTALRKWWEREEIKASAQISRTRAARRDGKEQDILPKGPLAQLAQRAGGWQKMAVLLLIALALFVSIHVVLYSSFFSNFSKGIYDSVGTYQQWLERGQADNPHDIYTYLRWLWEEELPSLLLGAMGIALALYRGTNRFAIFASFWAMGILAAYSLITYKTPWLTLNISIPLAVVGGYAIQEICEKALQSRRRRVRVSLAGLAGILVMVSTCQAIDVSFFRYDDDSLAYVYAHTTRQIFSLLDKINQVVARGGKGTQTGIMVASPDYWPLPWYLRDFPNAGYWGKVVPPTQEALVIGEDTQEVELQQKLGDKYERIGTYVLRPGAVLVVYVRRDLK